MDNASFYDLFCDAFKCLPEDFNETMLWLCIFPNALFLARLLWRLNRDYFKPDLALIDQLKQVTDADEMRAELSDFYYRNPSKGLFRGWLKVRISGHQLLKVADKVFARTG